MNSEFHRDREEMNNIRKEHKTGWLKISESESIRLVLDAMLDAGESRSFSKIQLAQYAGITDEDLEDCFEFLLEAGIIKQGEEDNRYLFNTESSVNELVIELNQQVNSEFLEC